MATYADLKTLRGDYSRMRPDYTVDQVWEAYEPAEHALWRRLYERQVGLVERYACREFRESLAPLNYRRGIPHFDEINPQLAATTGWQIVAVPGLVPDDVFFSHLAERRFPVTVWLRSPAEFDYIVEPDVFHDFFGHVPLLFNRVFADYMQAYGAGGLKAKGLEALTFLSRLYWFTVEFGLIEQEGGLKVYGAGILSSGSEIAYCIEDKRPNRLRLNLLRVMRTQYHIDRFQDTYFVIRSFRELFDLTAPDFTPYYDALRGLPPIAPDVLLDQDVLLR